MNFEPLITKNIQYTDFVNRLVKETSKDHIFPTITVSRDPGSGGKAIAHKLAQRLKIKCFDEELIDMVAKEARIKRKLVKALDEKTQSTVETIVNTFLGYETLPEHTFIKSFASVVLSIAGSQPAIILGRGMEFVLPQVTNFRVRITAPRRVLIKYAMQYEGHTAAKAREIIDKYIKLRHDFVYKYFNKDITKPHYYDLVINTEFLTIDDAVEIILAGFKQKFKLT